MFIHPNILIGKRHIVPHAGTAADVGHSVDSGTEKKFADGFRFSNDIFEIFINH